MPMTFRRAIFLVHLTTGCAAAAVVFFMAATGFLLAWQRPLVAWQERGYRSPVPAGQSALSLDRLAAVAADSGGRRPSAIDINADPAAPVEVEFGREHQLFVNRYSGAVLGPGAVRMRAFFATMTSLHRWFGLPLARHASAKWVKGVFTLALLLMIATGLWLWMPRARSGARLRAAATLRPGLRGRARDWNRHNAVGIWSALPLAAIALTGSVLACGWMTHLLYWATASPQPSVHSRGGESVQAANGVQEPSPSAVTLQRVFAETCQGAAGWHRMTIRVPHAGDSTLEVLVDFGNGGRPDQQMEIVYSRASGTAVALHTFSSRSLGAQVRSFMKYIHTGEAGGLAGETLAGLASLACCILVWTGLSLALRRLRAQKSALRARAKSSRAATGVTV